MKYLLFIITLFFTGACFAQQADSLDIQVVYTKKRSQWLKQGHFRVNQDNIYEDSSFVVSKFCMGEFGGKVYFRDKITGIKYATTAVCPIAINKLHGSYFVTTSLAHMSGECGVIEIADPRQLALPEEWPHGGDTTKHPEDFYRHLYRGRNDLAGEIYMLAITSFIYNDQLYHIVRERYKGTYVARIENKKFVKVAMISPDDLCDYDPEVFYTADKHAIVLFKNQEFRGHYDIYENHIKVVRYQ